jgi:(R)-2-hydroxy-4-methylpentanoate CoA-transferase
MMLPLDGIKVVDLSTWAMAPAACSFLGDWGADVIKVEDPRTGDPLRNYMRYMFHIDDSTWPVTLYGIDNRNKRGVAVNLKNQQGKQIIYDLVAKADVFVTNLQRNSLEKLEITFEKLSAINPRLVYGHATGYGERGPEKDKPGYDGVAYWARSGLMGSFAKGNEPAFSQHHPGVGDQISGLILAEGLVLALFMRERTGIGQEVDVSLLGVGTRQLPAQFQFAHA